MAPLKDGRLKNNQRISSARDAAGRAEAKSMAAVLTGEEQRKGRFVTGGKPGPGRPKGSRNKLGEDFLAALSDDFAEHGTDVIAKVRAEAPAVYLKVVASLMPKEMKVEKPARSLHEFTNEELEAIIAEGMIADGDMDEEGNLCRH